MASDSMTIPEITATTAENTMDQFTPDIDELSINMGFNPASTFGMTELKAGNKPDSKTCQALINDLLSELDELDLVRSIKEIYAKRGITLRTHRKVDKKLLTTDGWISYTRYGLRPDSSTDAEKLFELEGIKTIFPLDYVLGTANLPYKITVPMMIDISKQAIQKGSFQKAEDYYKATRRIDIGHDIIRKVTEYIGSIVFENDSQLLTQQKYNLSNLADISETFSTENNLYIHIGEVNISLLKDPSYKTFRFAHAFSISSSVQEYTPNSPLNVDEYVARIGSPEDFKPFLLALALRSGYKRHKNVILLYSGEPWIKDLFPDALEILDFSHLKCETSKVSDLIFGGNIRKGNRFQNDTLNFLKSGDFEHFFVNVEKVKIKHPKRKDIIESYIDFLQKNKNIIDYPKFMENGFLIDSSTVEGNGSLRRLGFAKTRWSISTAQNMLSLIAKNASSSWNTIPPIVIRALTDPHTNSHLYRPV